MAASTLRSQISAAEGLANRLASFRTPTTGEPVNSSIVAAAHTFLKGRPTAEMVDLFLDAMPRSSIATRTRSATPQTREFVRCFRPLVVQARKELPLSEDEQTLWLAGVAGWSRKLLEADGGARDARGGGGRGGHRGGGRFGGR